ncbi:MAG: hypothetical protein H0W28_11765 [Pyrinomonadaceae bacterium]|nr:hypothetical protein [Pyrinomonadaceae bacterium]
MTSIRILIMWNDTNTPLAYFISFRTFGTWLHRDKRGSIDRFHNRYRSPYIPPNEKWRHYNGDRSKRRFARLATFGIGGYAASLTSGGEAVATMAFLPWTAYGETGLALGI